LSAIYSYTTVVVRCVVRNKHVNDTRFRYVIVRGAVFYSIWVVVLIERSWYLNGLEQC